MKALHFFVEVQAADETRFSQEPDHFAHQIRNYVTLLVAFHSEGPKPAVKVVFCDLLTTDSQALKILQSKASVK
jgi:hypothetical protein